MLTKRQEEFLNGICGCALFERCPDDAERVIVKGTLLKAPDGDASANRKRWMLRSFPEVKVRTSLLRDRAYLEKLQHHDHIDTYLTDEEALEAYTHFFDGRMPREMRWEEGEIRYFGLLGTGYAAVPKPARMTALDLRPSFPVLWIWDLEASLAANYRREGIKGLLTALRDIKAAKPGCFEDEVHVDVSGTFPTLHDAEVFASGLAYAHSGQAQGAPSDVFSEGADVFVTDPGDVEALTAFFTQEGLL